jgi:hypothetical protein
MSSEKHPYSVLEVLRRGVPIGEVVSSRETNNQTTPLARFVELYNNWLRTSAGITEILSAYGSLFAHSEYMLEDPDMSQQLANINGPHLMNGMIGGDVEAGLIEVVSSWDLPKTQRLANQKHARIRHVREGRRIARIAEKIASQDDAQDAQIELAECSKKTMRDYSSDVTSEGLRLALQLGTYDVLGHLLDYTSQPPQRGIREVGSKITRLACEGHASVALYASSSDNDALRDNAGAILEAETLLLLWHACRIGALNKAWPIAASQRLDYGYFRPKKDTRNTDMLCMFLADDTAIPIQVHGAKDTMEGEGTSVAVVHSKDIYAPSARDKRYGSVILGFLGESNGFSMDYLDMRATFLASKIKTLEQRILNPVVNRGILVR